MRWRWKTPSMVATSTRRSCWATRAGSCCSPPSRRAWPSPSTPRPRSRKRWSARATPRKRRSAASWPACCGSGKRRSPPTRPTAWPWRSRTSCGRDRPGRRSPRRQAGGSRDDPHGGRRRLRNRRPAGRDGAPPRGGVMERLPAVGETVTLATELVVREDGWSLYGFQDDAGRRFFQRLIGVSGVGPKIAIALMSALGVERGARAVKERNIALLASVSGIGKKTAERLALELADKLGDFEEAVAAGVAPGGGAAEAALHALERLGYATAEADRALRQALA